MEKFNLSEEDLAEFKTESVIDAKSRMLSIVITSVVANLVQYPFTLAQTLNQVQSLPRNVPIDQDYEELEIAATEDDDEDYEYDSDGGSPVKRYHGSPTKLQTDQNGYILAGKPVYQLPNLRGSQYSTLRTLIKYRTEGFLSIYRGASLQCVQDISEATVQPAIEDFLNEQFGCYDLRVIPLVDLPEVVPNLCTVVASHLVTDLLTAPLEIARVRIAVQSGDPLRKCFRNPLSALCGGEISLSALLNSFFHWPSVKLTVLKSIVSSLMEASHSYVLSRILHLPRPSDIAVVESSTGDLFKWFLASVGFLTVQAIIVLPIQTLQRRRMLYQQTHVGVKTDLIQVVKYPCISVPEKVNQSALRQAATIIGSEAIGTVSKQRRRSSSSQYRSAESIRRRRIERNGLLWGSLGGLAQLYRGFWYQLAANILYSAVSTLTGLEVLEQQNDFTIYMQQSA
ncbi:hypothetical protein MP228_004531 [Amoeboaphelidium protococcarum]|nr:hypothetical protein MP228_004531 [Amoeboaphelidium protococcarum]